MDSKKITRLLTISNYKYIDLARYLGRFRQSVYNTRSNGTWTGDDLIKIAELTGTNLAFIDKNGKPIQIFNKNDI